MKAAKARIVPTIEPIATDKITAAIKLNSMKIARIRVKVRMGVSPLIFVSTYIYAIAVPTFAFPYKSIGYARLPRTEPHFGGVPAPQWSTISINMIVI